MDAPTAHASFSGPVDPHTGMPLEITRLDLSLVNEGDNLRPLMDGPGCRASAPPMTILAKHEPPREGSRIQRTRPDSRPTSVASLMRSNRPQYHSMPSGMFDELPGGQLPDRHADLHRHTQQQQAGSNRSGGPDSFRSFPSITRDRSASHDMTTQAQADRAQHRKTSILDSILPAFRAPRAPGNLFPPLGSKAEALTMTDGTTVAGDAATGGIDAPRRNLARADSASLGSTARYMLNNMAEHAESATLAECFMVLGPAAIGAPPGVIYTRSFFPSETAYQKSLQEGPAWKGALPTDETILALCMPWKAEPSRLVDVREFLYPKRTHPRERMVAIAMSEVKDPCNPPPLRYCVCLTVAELAEWAPSWLHAPSTAAAEVPPTAIGDIRPGSNGWTRLKNAHTVERCYCLVTTEPFLSTHFTFLEELVASETRQRRLIFEEAMRSQKRVSETRPSSAYSAVPIPEVHGREEYSVLNAVDAYCTQDALQSDRYSPGSRIDNDPFRVEMGHGRVREFALLMRGNDACIAKWALGMALRRLRPVGLVNLLACCLMEYSIVLRCEDRQVLTTVALALLVLMRPFSWQGSLQPVIRDDIAEDFIESPTPFICGTRLPLETIQASLRAASERSTFSSSSSSYASGVRGSQRDLGGETGTRSSKGTVVPTKNGKKHDGRKDRTKKKGSRNTVTLGPIVIDFDRSQSPRNPLVDIATEISGDTDKRVVVDIAMEGPRSSEGVPNTTFYYPPDLKKIRWRMPYHERLVDGLQNLLDDYRRREYEGGFDYSSALELVADAHVYMVLDMIGERAVDLNAIIEQDPYRHGMEMDARHGLGPKPKPPPPPSPRSADAPPPEYLAPFNVLNEWHLTTRLGTDAPEYHVVKRMVASQHFLSFWPTLLKAAQHRTMLLPTNPVPRNSAECRRQIRALLFHERRFRGDT